MLPAVSRGRRTALIGSTVVSGVTAVAVMVDLHFRFAAGQPELQGAFETAASLIAVLAAVLAFARLRRRRDLTDLALASALSVIALSNVFFAVFSGVTGLSAGNVAIWSAITSRSLGSLLFCIAAFVPVRPLRRSRRAMASVAACVAGGLALIFSCSWSLAGWLPSPVTVAAPAGTPVRPVLHAAPVLLGLEMVTAVFAVLAAVGYLRRSGRFGDEFSGWLAIAAVFAAAAYVNYLVYPSPYGRVVSAGDAFRLGFYAVLLSGSIREIWSYWVALSDTRVASERRRIARDLHDGVAQELAYLSRNLKSLEGDVEGEALGRLRRAAERARLESRLAISGLAVVANPATGEALADAVGEVAKRFGLDLELDSVAGLWLPASSTDALVRIGCEAVTNAARHSGVSLVAVSLRLEGTRVRMLVRDRGSGFDPAASTTGFGLTSMRERAQSVGAVLVVSSEPGQGSQVEVVL